MLLGNQLALGTQLLSVFMVWFVAVIRFFVTVVFIY